MGATLNGGSVRILWERSSSATVTITNTTGAPVSFTVDGEVVTFPYTLSESTTFDTEQSGRYEVSVIYSGVEIANTPDGTRLVNLSNRAQETFAPGPDTWYGGGGGGGTGTFEGTQTIHQGHLILDLSDVGPTAAPEIHYEGYSGNWFQGIDVVNPVTSRDFVFVGVYPEYSFDDGATTSGSPVLTSPAHGGFSSNMVGESISGPGIPSGTTVASVESATSLTMSANATATATGLRITANRTSTGADDIFYMKHRGALAPTLGLGVGVPGVDYRFTLGPGYVGETAMGGLQIWRGPGTQTGDPLNINSGSQAHHVKVNSDLHISGKDAWSGASVVFRASAGNNNVIALVDQNKGTNIYGFDFNGNNIMFRHLGGVNYLEFTGWNQTIDAKVKVNANNDVEVTDSTKGVILRSPNGTRYRVTVSDAGALTTTAL